MAGSGDPLRVEHYEPDARADAGATQPVFFYDLGSPECYLIAERVMSTMPVIPEWEPVLASALDGDPPRIYNRREIETIAARAAEQELLALRWPAVWPQDTAFAMLAATYAKQIGRAVVFSQVALRQVFAGGRDLGDENTVLIAAAACEIHPRALLKGVGLKGVAADLAKANQRARAAGVTQLPAIQVGTQLFQGVDAPEAAAAALERAG